MVNPRLPIQNSGVYLLGSSPSPPILLPSPSTPPEPCDPISPFSDGNRSPQHPVAPNPTAERSLERAIHVLGTEAEALSSLNRLYDTDPIAGQGFTEAIQAIANCQRAQGKLVVSGVGKSGHIAKKLVSTMNSLKIQTTYLHPTEALHGDIGQVGKHDCFLLITYSGKTPEILSLLPHLDPSLPLIVMTSHLQPSSCEVIQRRPNSILLPAPIHKSEAASFSVSAPTTSTTVALALGDALSIVVAEELHSNVAAVFSQNHPGGAIGSAFRTPQRLSNIVIESSKMIDVELDGSITGGHALMTAYRSEKGWIRCGDSVVVPPRKIKSLQLQYLNEPVSEMKGFIVPMDEWICFPAETSLSAVVEWIKGMRQNEGHRFGDEAVLAALDDNKVIGFLEVAELMKL